jgi:hypothetical protein
MKAIPLSAIVFHWITTFGVPATITSDYRPQSRANVWAAFCNLLSILHHQTTAYHPEVSDEVEKRHHRLKGALCACAAAATWAEEISWILNSLRSQPREDTDLSLAEAVFGALFVLPNELLQYEEFSIDQIVKKLAKVIDTPAFSLPIKHNSRRQLPDKLPGYFLHAHLI